MEQKLRWATFDLNGNDDLTESVKSQTDLSGGEPRPPDDVGRGNGAISEKKPLNQANDRLGLIDQLRVGEDFVKWAMGMPGSSVPTGRHLTSAPGRTSS